MPSGQPLECLSRIILDLSGEYASPGFDPHVTLLGGLAGSEKKITSKAEQLVRHLRPFTIKLTTVDYLDEYFRCLFIKADETPPLLEAHRIAAELFHHQPDSPFMPHLSLMYSHLDRELKQEIAARMDRRYDPAFEVNSVHLFSTTGEVKEWYRVREFRFPEPLA